MTSLSLRVRVSEGGIEVLVGNQIAEVQSINPEGTRMNIHMPESVPGMEDVQLRVKGKHTIANAGYHFLHSGTKFSLSPLSARRTCGWRPYPQSAW